MHWSLAASNAGLVSTKAARFIYLWYADNLNEWFLGVEFCFLTWYGPHKAHAGAWQRILAMTRSRVNENPFSINACDRGDQVRSQLQSNKTTSLGVKRICRSPPELRALCGTSLAQLGSTSSPPWAQLSVSWITLSRPYHICDCHQPSFLALLKDSGFGVITIDAPSPDDAGERVNIASPRCVLSRLDVTGSARRRGPVGYIATCNRQKKQRSRQVESPLMAFPSAPPAPSGQKSRIRSLPASTTPKAPPAQMRRVLHASAGRSWESGSALKFWLRSLPKVNAG